MFTWEIKLPPATYRLRADNSKIIIITIISSRQLNVHNHYACGNLRANTERYIQDMLDCNSSDETDEQTNTEKLGM